MSDEEIIKNVQSLLSFTEFTLGVVKSSQNKNLSIEAQSKNNTIIACLEHCATALKEEIRLVENGDYTGAYQMSRMAEFYSKLSLEIGT